MGSDPPELKYTPDYFLRLSFDDISLSYMERETAVRYALRMFSAEHAKQIVDFVYDCKDKIELLICQCQLGVSRSAAVAAAIKQHFDGDGISIFADGRYHPNIFVFSTTMRAFGAHGSEENK